jgi:hypothetical protein
LRFPLSATELNVARYNVGVPLYWVVIGGKNFKTGEQVTSRRLGPYESEAEAEDVERLFWQEIDEKPWESVRDYVYHAQIESETNTE